jgi:putative drug exporter of the RND superfamily
MGGVFSRLGAFCVRRRRLVLVAWLLVGVAGVLASGPVFGRLEGGGASRRFESIQGSDLRSAGATYGGRVLAVLDGVPVTDPRLRAVAVRATADLRRIRNVARAADFTTVPAAVATDGRAGLLVADLAPRLGRHDRDAAVDAVQTRMRAVAGSVPGLAVTLGGSYLLDREVNEQTRRDTEHAEIVSLPLTLIAMVVIFAGLLAAGLPLIGAIASVAGGLVCLLGFSEFMTLDPNTVPVITLLSLGISIDYALLVVSRFREERARGLAVADAVPATVATAGRTITFSALTVAACLSGLFVFDDPTFRAIGAAGAAVVIVALLAGLTLTPALLAVVGGRIRVRRGLAPERGFFSRLATWVQRRSWPVAVGLGALLLLAGAPLLSVRLQNGGADLLPSNLEAARAQTLLGERFPGGDTDPVVVIARTSPAALDRWLAGAGVPPGEVASTTPAVPLRNGYAQLSVTPAGDTQGDTAQRLVRDLRAHRPPVESYVTGTAAILVDFKAEVLRKLPSAFGLTALASLVLLFLMTGSLLVPVKALVMNTVSLGATFGALVWVFQDGHLSGLLGFTSPGAVETWVPVLVFAFAFGLSMDYEVFLISRIKELYDAGASAQQAVRDGLQRSGRIITSAALLIVIVFVGFATGRLIGIKEMGFALAVAIVVDATLVRCLLVPATMTLLGDRNWWAPGPLRRLHARFGLREQAPARAGAREPVGSD